MVDLRSLIGQREREDLENKLVIHFRNDRDKARFAERVSGIANRGGGYIVVGVDNRQRLVGINRQDIDEDQMRQALADRCSPPVAFSLRMVDYKGKLFAVIKIAKRKSTLHQIRKTGAVWVRCGAISRRATVDEIYEMMKETKGAEPSVQFLVNEIYSPLYEEVSLIAENVSELKPHLQTRYGRPDYSAPLPRDKVPGYIRLGMRLTGKYEIVPENLRKNLDELYDECAEYDKMLSVKNNEINEKQKQILGMTTNMIEELRRKIRDPLH